MFHRIHSNILSLFFIAIFVGNAFVLHNTHLGWMLLILYVGAFGWELGGVICHLEKAILRWWMGIWILLSCVMIVLTIFYYLWMIPPEVIWAVILLTPPIILWLCKRATHSSWLSHLHDLWHERKHKIPKIVWLAAALLLVLFWMFFSLLLEHQVTDAVRSVWERLPEAIFLLFFFICACVFALLWRGAERAFSVLWMSVLLFAFLSVVAFVFPLGFGFDSFIHKATETHLAQFGTITPKPFYYIGQYALVLFLHHGFLIPIDLADTFLVPVLTALLLPCAWFFAAAHITKKRSVSMMTLMGLFLIPLSGFILTTPQSLANLWTLLLILASVPYLLGKEHPRLRVLLLGACATMLIHPLAGIPAVLYFIFLATDPSRTNPRTPKTNKTVRFALIALSCVVLPLSFIINSLMNHQTIEINWAALSPLSWFGSLNLGVFFENRFSPLLDLVYLYGLNALIIVIIISLFAWKEYRADLSHRFRALALMILALCVNYFIISRALEFTFLIDYERANYASRLVPLISFFMTPFLILGLGHFALNIKTQPFILRACSLVLMVTIATSSFYLAYPRRDAYETSHGFNVSQSDIDAVYLVEQLSEGQPYIALANQSVSAAAIQEIGFRYWGDLFFYPIPTGGELYDYFLRMNESPTRQTAQEALSLIPMHGDIQTVFFLVNNYWWESARIIETAKTTADDWRSIGPQGQVYVFRYEF